VKRILTIAAVSAAAIAVPAASAQASFVLKPGQTKSYRCDGWNACVKRAKVVGAERLKRIAPGCWSSPRTYFESCTMTTDCRMPRGVSTCWTHNGSRVRLRVWRT
jgi:hypothetical protein